MNQEQFNWLKCLLYAFYKNTMKMNKIFNVLVLVAKKSIPQTHVESEFDSGFAVLNFSCHSSHNTRGSWPGRWWPAQTFIWVAACGISDLFRETTRQTPQMNNLMLFRSVWQWKQKKNKQTDKLEAESGRKLECGYLRGRCLTWRHGSCDWELTCDFEDNIVQSCL